MKIIFLCLSLFISFTTSAQVLKLSEIEFSVKNIGSGEYKEKLSTKGFELVETKKDGASGIYEKWARKDNALFVTIQHNDSFKFTKVLITSAEATSKPTIRNILDEISRNYSKQTINDQVYYLSDENPELTIHVVKLEKNDTSVEGVMFFRKYN